MTVGSDPAGVVQARHMAGLDVLLQRADKDHRQGEPTLSADVVRDHTAIVVEPRLRCGSEWFLDPEREVFRGHTQEDTGTDRLRAITGFGREAAV